MRVFVALMPDSASMELLKPLIQNEKGWHHPLDLHMTLRFLGKRNDFQVESIKGELGSCSNMQSVEWYASRLGGFPDHINPKVWALEGALNLGLESILAELEALELEALITCKPEVNSSVFRPHVSLCAKKSLLNGLVGTNLMPDGSQLQLRFDRVVLMESVDSAALKGPRYQVLWQRSLSA